MPTIDRASLPTRWYPPHTFTVQGVAERVPEGLYPDHTSYAVEQLVYELRNRQGDDRMTHEDIALHLGLRHWRDSYNAARNYGRRRDGEDGRDREGRLTWRAWNRRGMRDPGAAPSREGARDDSSLVTRRFGIEVEYNHPDGTFGTHRSEIAQALTAVGVRAQTENYNHTTRHYWKVTTDATVSGGEVVSPVLAGDTASLDDVREVLRAVKAAGGTTARSVGMHVHHDVMDFTTERMRQSLVDVLQHTERAMSNFVHPDRLGRTACGASLRGNHEWTLNREAVRRIRPGQARNGYHDAYNVDTRYSFYNITGPMAKYGTVEFRGLGATLHAGKVRVWIRVGQALIEFARQSMTFMGEVSSRDMIDRLVAEGLLGRRTGERFMAEVERRHPETVTPDAGLVSF